MLSAVETSLKITFSCGRRGTAFAVVEELLELFTSFYFSHLERSRNPKGDRLRSDLTDNTCTFEILLRQSLALLRSSTALRSAQYDMKKQKFQNDNIKIKQNKQKSKPIARLTHTIGFFKFSLS